MLETFYSTENWTQHLCSELYPHFRPLPLPPSLLLTQGLAKLPKMGLYLWSCLSLSECWIIGVYCLSSFVGDFLKVEVQKKQLSSQVWHYLDVTEFCSHPTVWARRMSSPGLAHPTSTHLETFLITWPFLSKAFWLFETKVWMWIISLDLVSTVCLLNLAQFPCVIWEHSLQAMVYSLLWHSRSRKKDCMLVVEAN